MRFAALMFILLALALPVAAAPVSVPLTLSLTPQPPPPFTATVSQPVTIAGVTYTMSGTLTFTPVVTTAALPVWHPLSYRNAAGQEIAQATEGEPVRMAGSGFGSAPGRVVYDSAIPVPVQSWTDTELALTLPHVAGIPHIPAVQVLSPAGTLLDWCNNGGLVILPKPH